MCGGDPEPMIASPLSDTARVPWVGRPASSVGDMEVGLLNKSSKLSLSQVPAQGRGTKAYQTDDAGSGSTGEEE